MALRVGAETLLFGVPEDTQRRLLAAPQVRPSRITRIFVAAAVADQLSGLPGISPRRGHLQRLRIVVEFSGHLVPSIILSQTHHPACCRVCRYGALTATS